MPIACQLMASLTSTGSFAQLAIETMERVLPWYTVASTSSLPVFTGFEGTHQPNMRVLAMPI